MGWWAVGLSLVWLILFVNFWWNLCVYSKFCDASLIVIKYFTIKYIFTKALIKTQVSTFAMNGIFDTSINLRCYNLIEITFLTLNDVNSFLQFNFPFFYLYYCNFKKLLFLYIMILLVLQSQHYILTENVASCRSTGWIKTGLVSGKCRNTFFGERLLRSFKTGCTLSQFSFSFFKCWKFFVCQL